MLEIQYEGEVSTASDLHFSVLLIKNNNNNNNNNNESLFDQKIKTIRNIN